MNSLIKDKSDTAKDFNSFSSDIYDSSILRGCSYELSGAVRRASWPR